MKTREPKIWMPLYVAEYLADTGHLTTEQHGAYLLLIMHYWRRGPLPDDDAALAAITRLSPAAWKRNRAVLAGLFQVEPGCWRHKRVDFEIAKGRDNKDRVHTARSAAGKAGAAKRWGGGGGGKSQPPSPPKDTGPDSNCHPFAMANNRQTDSTSPSPITNLPPAIDDDGATSRARAYGEASNVVVDDSLADVQVGRRPQPQPPPPGAPAQPDEPPEAVQDRAVALRVLMRRAGVAVNADDPRVQRWALERFTEAEALAAIEAARRQRTDEASAQPVNAGLVDAILRANRARGAAGPLGTARAARSLAAGRSIFGDERWFAAALAEDAPPDPLEEIAHAQAPRIAAA